MGGKLKKGLHVHFPLILHPVRDGRQGQDKYLQTECFL